MRIASGSTDRKLSFIAVDATDLVTPETGLSSFTVYRSVNGGTPVAYTTPTVTELDSTNMPGAYALDLDEALTLNSARDTEEVLLRITCSGMAPVYRTFELYRPETTEGQTLTVSSGTGNAAVQSIAASAITASAIASDAITSLKIADGAITAAKIADAAIDSATFAPGAIDASSIAAGGANKIADHTIRRTLANARASSNGDTVNARSLLGAASKLKNAWDITSGTLTVMEEDDTTPFFTEALTGTTGADPITAVDPT